VVPDDSAAEIPAGLDMAAAATVPMSGLTAQLAVDRAIAGGARRIAVTGAGGAVGAFAIELAREAGLETFGVVRPAYAVRARALGTNHVIDADADWNAAIRTIVPEGVDAVIDCALLGEATLGAIRDGGALITVRGFAGELTRGIVATPVSVRDYEREQGKLKRLLRLAGEGRLHVFVHQTLPFTDAAEAHRLVEMGGLGGRVLLSFDREDADGDADGS